MYDLLIVGCGPAGMTAAVYAARKKLDTLLLTEDFGGQPMWTMEIENYMGYQYITGPELMEKFEEQMQKFPVRTEYEAVQTIEKRKDGGFLVKTAEHEYETKTVIIASGKRPRRLTVPGETEYSGRGVSYCATCDGPLFNGKPVAVVGGGNSAVQAALELARLAEKVYLVVRDGYIADPILLEQLPHFENITEVVGYQSKQIEGTKFVEKLVVEDLKTRQEKVLAVEGIFVEIGLLPNTDFVRGFLKLNDQGEIIVDCRAQTSVSGIFAAGDVNDGPDKQIVIAAGDGAKAVLGVYDYLLYHHPATTTVKKS